MKVVPVLRLGCSFQINMFTGSLEIT